MVRMSARRAPAAVARRSASCTAGISPDSTNWTSALRLAIQSLPFSAASTRMRSTSDSSRPTIAIMPTCSPAVCAITRPRSFTSSSAVSHGIEPAAAREAISPRLWPAVTLTFSSP